MSSQLPEVPLSQASLQTMARQAAVSNGVNPAVFAALIQQESGWNPNALSPAGAQGLGQLMPATASSLGVTNPNDPTQNLRGAARYFKQQLDTFGGNYNEALAAYNAGPEAVRKYGGIPPYPETQHYVSTIMGNSGVKGNPAAPEGTGYQMNPAAFSNAPIAGQAQPQVTQPQMVTRSMLLPETTFTPGAEQNVQTPTPSLQLPGMTIRQPTDLIKWLQSRGDPVNPVVAQALRGTQRLMQQPLRLPGLPTATTTPVKIEVSEPKLGSNTQVTMSGNGTLPIHYANGAKPSSQADHAVALAHEYLGTPYVYGGESTSGFDCSGLLQYVWAKQGVSIPRTTYDQFSTGTPVPQNKLVPGDAVFFKGSDPEVRGGKTLPGHVGMYIGNGDIIQAPYTGTVVQVTPLSAMKNYMGARRYA